MKQKTHEMKHKKLNFKNMLVWNVNWSKTLDQSLQLWTLLYESLYIAKKIPAAVLLSALGLFFSHFSVTDWFFQMAQQN